MPVTTSPRPSPLMSIDVHEAEVRRRGRSRGRAKLRRRSPPGRRMAAAGDAARRDRMLLPVGLVERPLALRTSAGASNQPRGRQDVVAAVAVDVSRADAVAVAVVADHVLDPLPALQLEPRQRRRRADRTPGAARAPCRRCRDRPAGRTRSETRNRFRSPSRRRPRARVFQAHTMLFEKYPNWTTST